MSVRAENWSIVLSAFKQILRQANTNCKVTNEIIWTSSVKKYLKPQCFKTACLEKQVAADSDWDKDFISFYTCLEPANVSFTIYSFNLTTNI